jgi:hypothetical protein
MKTLRTRYAYLVLNFNTEEDSEEWNINHLDGSPPDFLAHKGC